MLHELTHLEMMLSAQRNGKLQTIGFTQKNFDAFLQEDGGFFAINYPLLDDDLQEDYNLLFSGITECIQAHITDGVDIPSWVYSYMLGNTLSIYSDSADIAYLYELLGLPTEVYDTFGADLQPACLEVSKEWLSKLPAKYGSRPATLFGEPHVIKSLRLAAANAFELGGEVNAIS